ncbi:hypothetical protein B0T25DRAFT_583715 [Lasiosphaeria hispida]|uniref:Heterokaryon incompatibility domain-containing protein n=1 Tax=Lasiosphaeria hispida TaxID=260671 RepID=A0AAJ0MAX4_9PEZI|nr:hypothetical protein B0T25DRAFT_583715 [Lasiosphaeria hispida]
MPARVIAVGRDGDDRVRLWEPSAHHVEDYVVLSHPWGIGPHFVTNVESLEQHKEGIKIGHLPATFRDAVITTRALGKKHLWIDSICIIQGPGGDFQHQAKHMETVFNSAYCVLAASRAHNQTGGFLHPRRERDCVMMREGPGGPPFYICENTDGTIFFTERQTYWECGDGVRCETLTKMTNNLAAFLGDPNFPGIIMSASQGEKIIRLLNLFKTYSSLAFTNASDRPVAVGGIQSCLLKAFETQGGYGILSQDDDDGKNSNLGRRGLLRRGLLWYRPANKEALVPITFPPSQAVPSWSWMAYMGQIDFLRPGFGTVEWMEL